MSVSDETLPRVALVGFPNVGKTTLFNALTGSNQKIGNFTGVTVSKVTGSFYTPHGQKMELIDLPGTYSLSPKSDDELVTSQTLIGTQENESKPDLILCVTDAKSLERQLHLVHQIIDTKIPVVLVLNMVDEAEKSGVRFAPDILSDELGIPVVPCQANSKKGLTELKQSIRLPFPHCSKNIISEINSLQDLENKEAEEKRLSRAKMIGKESIRRETNGNMKWNDRIDAVALHPFFGWVLLASIMFGIFWSIFKYAGYPMDWIEGLFGLLSDKVTQLMPAGVLRDLIIDGMIGGVGGVVVFLPQILILFFFIALLEGSGYLSRAAFLMDRVMGTAKLSGKSFLPMLSGYACAIPGIMATRSIPSAKERLATMMVLPWTSCSARLPVYLLLVPLLLSNLNHQTWVMFGIYALGTITALIAARLLRSRFGEDDTVPFMLELPPYRWPDLSFVWRHVAEKGMAFLKKAGTLILGISILLWALESFPKVPEESEMSQHEYSLLGRAGNFIEPVVKPLGWDGRIGTAVLASFAAREVFNSSMSVSYAVEDEEDSETLRNRLQAAKWPDGRPVFTLASILSLLVFYIYALQCLPTTAVVKGETKSWKLALGQLFGMSFFAYIAAFLTFQIVSLL